MKRRCLWRCYGSARLVRQLVRLGHFGVHMYDGTAYGLRFGPTSAAIDLWRFSLVLSHGVDCQGYEQTNDLTAPAAQLQRSRT